ncbi:hypothetical protein RMATCC62417_13216 [Rhizopus microsporus]|nr:hypothetical protein RMATCC62417_13216 [Rhizopus microsporus]
MQLHEVMNGPTTVSTATDHASNIDRITVIVCMILCIWRFHWRVVFQVLHDPKYDDRTSAEREYLAFMHHYNRIERVLQYIRALVKYTVARFFYSKGWTNKTLSQETLPSRRKASD